MSADASSLVKQNEAELKEMQEQIEACNQMVKQLNSQREMAIKKLSDLGNQVEELNKALENERAAVEAKDRELQSKREQLQALNVEEKQLNEKSEACKKKLDSTNENLTLSQLTERQVKNKLEELQNFLAQTEKAIDDIDKAISIEDPQKLGALCNQMLTLPPLSINVQLTNGVKPGQADSSADRASLFDNPNDVDPFANEDPFEGDDPFKSNDNNLELPEDDPFNPSSSVSSGFVMAQNDPFAPNPMGGGF